MNTGYYMKAELYDRYRWQYPETAIKWITNRTGLGSHSVICDVGAGTGKLTERFNSFVKKVYAIEPDEKMLEILERKELKNVITLQKSSDRVCEVNDDSIDVIIVAHALHWFNYPSTLNEFNRILRDQGLLVNLSNIYKENNDVNDEIIEAIDKFRKPNNYLNKNDNVLNDYCSGYEQKEFDFTFANDLESYIGGNCSASFYPDESDGEIYRKMRSSIIDIFTKKCSDGKIKMKCSCIVQIGELRKK
jgi:ubiquinone/menaquinone biosynthesis C-methylase UbiE